MKSLWQRFLTNPRVIIGALWLGLVVAVAVLADVLAPRDPFAIVGAPFIRPGGALWLGTDSLGRDVMAGLVHGARTTRTFAGFALPSSAISCSAPASMHESESHTRIVIGAGRASPSPTTSKWA